jgi:hypothetical protein
MKELSKFCLDRVDDHFLLRYFVGPAESGTPLLRSFVLRTFGTANWNSILSRHDFPIGNYRRREIEFFCRLKCT